MEIKDVMSRIAQDLAGKQGKAKEIEQEKKEHERGLTQEEREIFERVFRRIAYEEKYPPEPINYADIKKARTHSQRSAKKPMAGAAKLPSLKKASQCKDKMDSL